MKTLTSKLIMCFCIVFFLSVFVVIVTLGYCNVEKEETVFIPEITIYEPQEVEILPFEFEPVTSSPVVTVPVVIKTLEDKALIVPTKTHLAASVCSYTDSEEMIEETILVDEIIEQEETVQESFTETSYVEEPKYTVGRWSLTSGQITESELEMLACVIYQEAGADACSDLTRYMIGDVVLNRVNDPRFPNTIYEVLVQKNQYDKFYYTGIIWPSQAFTKYEANAVARAFATAEDLLAGNHSKLYGNGYIWQAEFIQGTDIIYQEGIYFGRG